MLWNMPVVSSRRVEVSGAIWSERRRTWNLLPEPQGCAEDFLKLWSEAVPETANNSLEPTPVTKARFVWFSSGAAQLSR